MSVLAGADRAAFVTGLGSTLRTAGVPVDLGSLVAFGEALAVGLPQDVESLYWTARTTLVHRHEHLPTFDAVFDAVFRVAVQGIDPRSRRAARERDAGAPGEAWAPAAGTPSGDADGSGLPWCTLPRVVPDTEESCGREVSLPELRASPMAAIAEAPLDALDPTQLAQLEAALRRVADRWPTRRGRRRSLDRHGPRIALRETLAASRRTGWEPIRLHYSAPRRRPRPVTVLVDVSRSMQPYAMAYLHLLRVLVRTGHCEAFVFSTELTRLTPALLHHSPREALRLAEAAAPDRFGGTHLAGSLRALRRSRHGNGLRGGVLLLASDGWDSDPPEELGAELARVARRTHRILWLNPRAAAPGFEPRVGGMAAALPFCDAFLPGHTPEALLEVLDTLLEA